MTGRLTTVGHKERWAQVESVFTAALDTPPEARESLLASRCADETLRAEVRRLLARHDSLSAPSGRGAGFLEAINPDCAAELLDDGPDPATIGRYQILGRVGRGASGVVYLGHDPSLDRRVALKVLAPHLNGRPEAVRRFAEEARTASALDHPHIATIHEIGHTEDGRLFISMAYYDGETVRARLVRGPLPEHEAVRIAAEVADGLSAAHARNIVHRDIKPENILLTPGGACIVDFGIAKVLGGHTATRTGAALGTAAYMSPEQTRGAGVDHRSDLWSVGVVLYEMLTGVRPFEADGGEALIYGIRHDVPTPVTARRNGLAPALVQVVDLCLKKDPDKRFQSADALRSALLAPLPSSAGIVLAQLPWKRFRVAVAGVAAAAAALLAAPRGHKPAPQLIQVSTALPLPQHPGAVAILSMMEQRSAEPLEGRKYITEGIVGGIGDELTRGLSGTPGIRVSFRPSVRILAETGADVRAIGRRLGVTAVLKWDLRHNDSLISIDAELIGTSDGRKLWSQVYERPVGEVGAIPDEIRRSVATILGTERAGFGGSRRGPTNDLVAYDLYLRGRFAQSKWTPGGLDEASLLFRQAIARDSGFALAYTWLADVFMTAWSGAAADRLRRVKPMVAKALELGSTLAYAQRMAGYIAMWQDRDWITAERHLSRALALDSSDIWNYHFYASYLAAIGRTDESVAIARRATALDPLSSVTATQVGFYLFLQRRYAEAIAVLERAAQVDRIWWQKMPMTLGKAYLAVGRHDEAIAQFRQAGLESSHGFEAPALLAYALGVAGRTDEARALASQYVEKARSSSARPLDLIAVHLGVGDTAQALDWVERLPDDRGSRFYLLSDPIFDPLRESPRFQRVLEHLGLGDAAHQAALRPVADQ